MKWNPFLLLESFNPFLVSSSAHHASGCFKNNFIQNDVNNEQHLFSDYHPFSLSHKDEHFSAQYQKEFEAVYLAIRLQNSCMYVLGHLHTALWLFQMYQLVMAKNTVI